MKEIKRILIIRLSSMGDIILTFPVIEALKNSFPSSEIFYLTKNKYKDLLKDHPQIDYLLELDSEGKHKNVSGFVTLIKELNGFDFDLIIDLHANLRSFFVRRLVRGKAKLKYKKRGIQRFLIVHCKFLKMKSKHTIDLYLDVLKRLKFKGSATGWMDSWNRIPKYHLEDKNNVFAQQFLKEKGWKDEMLIGMAPGARWKTKIWDKEKFAETGKILSEQFSAKILLCGDESDRERIGWIGNFIRKDKSINALNLPLNHLAGVIHRCTVFISNDSGLMHLASSLGIPTIAIFGPTHPKLGFAPLGLMDRVLMVGEKCSPCSLHGEKQCYQDKRYCMEKILPSDVVEIVERLLKSQKVVFIDRDGTLVEENNFLSRVEEVNFIPGSFEAIKTFKDLGYKTVAISNQSGIARKILSEKMVETINEYIQSELEKQGVGLDGVYYCPHHPEDNCACRKPETGLLKKASQQLNLDLNNAIIIGDKLSDVLLGKRIGAKTILVLTGYGKGELGKIQSNSKESTFLKPDFVGKDLLDASLWIKKLNLENKILKPK
jgi:heptosyltransferase II